MGGSIARANDWTTAYQAVDGGAWTGAAAFEEMNVNLGSPRRNAYLHELIKLQLQIFELNQTLAAKPFLSPLHTYFESIFPDERFFTARQTPPSIDPARIKNNAKLPPQQHTNH